ncbi:MAG TPA: RNA ligase family protein [Ktedonobacterales bacterium]|jgi:RNA ligase-like protein|nr:RNA ligase family protein [Ktedonobacterales bacterium]
MSEIHKYPRTRHIEGSGLQPGDDPECAPFADLAGRRLVVEEKMDGANSAISFAPDGRLLLQSRGHYLTGGPRERQFDLLKQWANRYAGPLWETLGDRYVLYGEWLYARHTIFYTDLPHYFLEFDALDTSDGVFLSTPARQELLRKSPLVRSVRVLHEGTVASAEALVALIGPSAFVSGAPAERLRAAARARDLDPEQALRESDLSGLMEGLYIKVEENGAVVERYKYVRAGFLQTVFDSESHWMDRPLIPNQLAPGVSLWDGGE